MRIFYLHGFASSARSTKAGFLAAQLAGHGVTLETPDFNHPDFSTLTITRMIEQVGRAIDAGPPAPVVLVGSSLGAFVAVQVAVARSAQIDRLVLLAPALDFGGNRMRGLGEAGLDEWKRTNRLPVFHYGFGRMMDVQYGLYADARRYDSINATLALPIQIFQGRQDDAVDPAVVERWAQSRPNVELHMLDDNHQLTASLDHVWREMKRFLGL
jgi:alpha-beta hydrolase superfamily lysophospholipase